MIRITRNSHWLLLMLLLLGTTRWSVVAAEEPVILVMGDSLSAAYRMPERDGWVALLADQIRDQDQPWQVVNASVSGETTAGGVARLPALLDTHDPTIVILQLGGNDGLRGLPVSNIRENLETMVRLSKDAGSRVLLAGIQIPPNYGPRYTEPFYAQYREIADLHEVHLLPFLLEGIAEDRSLMQADGIHPTAEAQPLILEQVWPVLEPMLEEHSDTRLRQ